MLRLAHSRTLNILTKSVAVALQRATAAGHQKAFVPITQSHQARSFSLTTPALCDADPENDDNEDNKDSELSAKINRRWNKYKGTDRDRSQLISVEESIEYMRSGAFKATYGDQKVWESYRRVHKGQLAKYYTRQSCIRNNVVITASPCPICRDEYLVLHQTNLELLRHFISPYTGEVLDTPKSGLCRLQNSRLLVCIERANDLGLLEYNVPFRKYDYAEYYDVYKKEPKVVRSN